MLLAFCPGLLFAAPAKEKPLPQIVFTDEKAQLTAPQKHPADQREVSFELSLLSRKGMEKLGSRTAKITETGFALLPEKEGIHIVRFSSGEEQRFLAIQPPSLMDAEQLRKVLPLTSAALLSGAPYVIGAYGDSVTATGHYPEILSKLLTRAIGKPVQISIVRRAHSGRSIDATMRTWNTEIAPEPPQLALIMYGLNDQAGGVSMDAYLEHYEVLAQRLRQELKADVMFLQPTPHIDVFPKAKSKVPEAKVEQPNPPCYAFRTIAFAKELELLAQRLNLPCAQTFQAIWGDGGPTLMTSTEAMRALYPPSYSKPMQSMLESENPFAGDTIHPNILGHLAMARAVLAALNPGPQTSTNLHNLPEMHATSYWKDGKIVTEMANLPEGAEIFGMPDQVPLKVTERTGTKCILEWPDIASGQDVLNSGAGREFAAGRGIVAVVTSSTDTTKVTPLPSRLSPQAVFERKRWNAVEASVEVKVTASTPLSNGQAGTTLSSQNVNVEIPPNSEGGMILLTRNLQVKASASSTHETIPAFARLWYTRYALAELPSADDAIKVDGDLSDWNSSTWSTLGEPLHARWTRGPLDNRATPEECYMKFAVRAGKTGIYLAINGKGDASRDKFVLYFDSRPAEQLGSPGSYYWVSGDLSKYPTVRIRNGETSPNQPVSKAELRQTAQGSDMEIFVPYEVIGKTAWPEGGDLGFSFWWTHVSAEKKTTQLQWSDTGHPWNTRWYGVIRQGKPGEKLPYMVRVE
ncbi:MAG TPA: SGNH/GDSL hydrolase family protein [Candidatus Methylacidiphilales bacterium]|nr:SGNH/GDSL hydrolase family protein [Candidatus Methylacidiphilales bacterium]